MGGLWEAGVKSAKRADDGKRAGNRIRQDRGRAQLSAPRTPLSQDPSDGKALTLGLLTGG